MAARTPAFQPGSMLAAGSVLAASREGTYILPVHTPRKEAKTFVSVGASEEVCKSGAVLICETENRDTCCEREDVFRHDLPNNDEQQDSPEDLETSLRKLLVQV